MKCEYCNGTGCIKAGWKIGANGKCEMCNGTGKVGGNAPPINCISRGERGTLQGDGDNR